MYGSGYGPLSHGDGDKAIEDILGLKRAAEDYVNAGANNKVWFKLIASEKDPLSAFEEVGRGHAHLDIDVTEFGDYHRVDVVRKIKRKDISGGERTVEGGFAFFRSRENEHIWIAMTGDDPDFFERGMIYLFNQMDPDVYSFYLSPMDIQQILQGIEESLDARVIVKRSITYNYHGEAKESHETHPFRHVFAEINEEENYVDKLEFRVEPRGDSDNGFEGFLTRDGRLKYINGNVSPFFDGLVSLIERRAEDRRRLFDESIDSARGGNFEQMHIKFDEPVFQGGVKNHSLINALSKMTKTSITVYHSNPYLHMSMMDYRDGSAFDIFVTENDRVNIVLGHRGTSSSLMRVAEHISSHFKQGEICPGSSNDYGFDDFF